MEDKALGLLGLMRRAGAIAIGMDNTADAVRAGKARLLLLSRDAADHARRKAENLSNGRSVLTVELPYSREELADSLGVRRATARRRRRPKGAARRRNAAGRKPQRARERRRV